MGWRARGRAALLLACLLPLGCAYKTYPNTLAKNAQIRTELDPGFLFFETIRASLEVHSVDPSCQTRYEGTVELDADRIRLGLPPGEPSYLVFRFATSSFLANSRTSMDTATLLTPRPDRDYEIEVSYLDDLYRVAIWETDPRRRTRRELGKRGLGLCTAARSGLTGGD